MVTMSAEDFENAVGDALDLVPEDLMDAVDNVVFLIEDRPPAEEPQDLLGLYVGTPLTQRDGWYGSGQEPDKIFIFRSPTLEMCQDADHVREEVAITVVHEIAHHFGIDDAALHEMGWG